MCWLPREANLFQSPTLRPMQALYTTTHSNALQPPSARWWHQTKVSKPAQRCSDHHHGEPKFTETTCKDHLSCPSDTSIRPPAAPALLLHSLISCCMECFLVEKSPMALHWFENLSLYFGGNSISVCRTCSVSAEILVGCWVLLSSPRFHHWFLLPECAVYFHRAHCETPDVGNEPSGAPRGFVHQIFFLALCFPHPRHTVSQTT